MSNDNIYENPNAENEKAASASELSQEESKLLKHFGRLSYEKNVHAWIRTGLVIFIAFIVLLLYIQTSVAVKNVRGNAEKLMDEANTLIEKAETSLEEADTILDDTKEISGRINGMMSDVEKTVGTISSTSEDLEDVVSQLKNAGLVEVIDDLHKAVNNLNTVVEPLSNFFKALG